MSFKNPDKLRKKKIKVNITTSKNQKDSRKVAVKKNKTK